MLGIIVHNSKKIKIQLYGAALLVTNPCQAYKMSKHIPTLWFSIQNYKWKFVFYTQTESATKQP